MLGDRAIGLPDERTQRARQAEFERMWQQQRPRIWRLVARLAGDLDQADDLTQEVSVRAFQAYGEFRRESSVFTWLYRIAINVVLRHRERRRGETVSLDSPEAAHLPDGERIGPEAAAMQAAMRPVIREALERLPDDLRTTLVLQVYEGLKYREIAAILNVPLDTVKYRRHQAMLRLREELKDDAM